MHTLSIFDIVACMDVDEITELHTQVVSRHLVHLYATFLDVIRAQADQDGIASLLSTAK